jgi:low temperature requirement protein LtrA
MAAALRRERGRSGGGVTNTELFFDLVYVFAITSWRACRSSS